MQLESIITTRLDARDLTPGAKEGRGGGGLGRQRKRYCKFNTLLMDLDSHSLLDRMK